MNEFTPFVNAKKSKIEKAKEKKAIKSKIAQFRKKISTNSPALIPTRAHEFHNDDKATLKGDKTKKKEADEEAPKTEEEIAKAQKEAKEQAKLKEMMKEHCGDIKDNKEKDFCFQAVANYVADEKEKAKRKEAKEKLEKENSDSNDPESNENGIESNDDEDEGSDNTDQNGQQPIIPIQPPAEDTTTTDGDNNQERVISLSKWKSLLESDIKIGDFLKINCGSTTDIETTDESTEESTVNEDSSVENLKSKALALHFSTNKLSLIHI